MPPRNIIDLFAGAGGFSLGAHLAGFKPALAIEIDKNLGSARGLNFPGTSTLFADVALIEPKAALGHAKLAPTDVVGIVGGPPCQGYSAMGRQNPDDERNGLVRRFFDYVSAIEPAFFVMENVPGILRPELRFHLDTGLNRVADRYEIVGPMILDAKDFGAATTRERVVIIGYRPQHVDAISELDIRGIQARPATIKEAMSDVPPPRSVIVADDGHCWGEYHRLEGKLSAYSRRARRPPPRGLSTRDVRESIRSGRVSGVQPTKHTAAVVQRFSELDPGAVDPISKYPRLKWGGICTTLRAGTGRDHGSFQAARPIHPDENRVITVREAARIQGFPDWFQFHPTIWHSFRMIGNSVSPLMAEALFQLLAMRVE